MTVSTGHRAHCHGLWNTLFIRSFAVQRTPAAPSLSISRLVRSSNRFLECIWGACQTENEKEVFCLEANQVKGSSRDDESVTQYFSFNSDLNYSDNKYFTLKCS